MRIDLEAIRDLLSLDSLSMSSRSSDESTCSVLQGLELLTIDYVSSDEEEDGRSIGNDDVPPSVVLLPVSYPLRRSTRTRKRPVRFMDEFDKYYR